MKSLKKQSYYLHRQMQVKSFSTVQLEKLEYQIFKRLDLASSVKNVYLSFKDVLFFKEDIFIGHYFNIVVIHGRMVKNLGVGGWPGGQNPLLLHFC
jgi:hypothetical protein